MNYTKLSDHQKKDYLIREYEQNGKSFSDIAKDSGTYANKVRRDAIKFQIKIRDKSEAQKNALSSGKVSHPTKGKQRSNDTKEKIGKSVLKSWENMDDKELLERRKKAQENWNKKSDDEKQNILREANLAVRESSKTGSKLEKYLHKNLLSNGYAVEFHKEQSILNTKLQIDIFLPALSLAIEIDGPSHFAPVWGADVLARNKKYDNKKSGLILGKGWYLIRVQQTKDFSNARASIILEELLTNIENIKSKKTDQNRIIIIGD